MLKKILLFVIVVALVGAGWFVYQELHPKPVISTQLSARSEAFIKKQQQATTSSTLKNVDFTGPSGPDTTNTRIGKEGCYSFIIPYRVTITRYDEDANGNTCYARYSFDTPKGAINAYKTKTEATALEDSTAVTFRRRHADEYLEERKILGGKQFLIFKSKGELYEANAFLLSGVQLFTFNLITKTNENLDADLYAMLESLEIE